jgi:hypothetical protein
MKSVHILSQTDIINTITDDSVLMLQDYTLTYERKNIKYGDYIRFVNKQNFEVHKGGNIIKIQKTCFIIISNDYTCYFYLPDNFYIFHKPHNNTINFKMLDDYKQQLESYKPVKYNNTLIVKDINTTKQSKSSKQRDAFEKLLTQLENKK